MSLILKQGSSSRVSALDLVSVEPFGGFAEAWRRVVNGTEKGCTDMALYEHVFLVRQDVSAQQVEAIADQYKAVIEGNGGAVKKVENWGLRALAYRVKKNRKAHYVLFNLDAPHAAVAELERQEGLSEDVLRTMTIRVDELEEGPSAMLQKRDRDERDGGPAGRGDRGGFRGGDRGPRRDRAPRRETEAGDTE